MRSLLLDVGCWNNIGRNMKPFAEVVETPRGESVVIPLPGELGFEITAGREGLTCFDDLTQRVVSTIPLPRDQERCL